MKTHTEPTTPAEPDTFAVTDRNRVRRISERGQYDKAQVYAIIDQCLVAHVGIVEGERPIVMPMACARDGDSMLIHGARKGRITESSAGQQVCLTMTLVDGLIYARSIFHSSMNYRSAMVFGTATAITDPAEQLAALRVLSEHLMPGRWDEVREPLDKELKATQVMRVRIESASAKVRDVGVLDEPSDYTPEQWASTWAGVVPIASGVGQPMRDPATTKGVSVPRSVILAARLGAKPLPDFVS
jgi:nitroimidazol reductase NimA-like FMN-containing flavoprotein (pyridoxamine 5'-phosphate oxidase superfamily)